MQGLDEKVWRALVAVVEDPERRAPLLDQLGRQLTPADASDLARLCHAPRSQEAQAAIRLFHGLVDSGQLTEDVLAFWADTLRDVIARQEINSPVWALAHLSLEVHGIEHRAADLAARGLSRDEYLQRSAVQSGKAEDAKDASISIMPLEEAVALLQQADAALSIESLSELALRWRSTRDPDAIHLLYRTC